MDEKAAQSDRIPIRWLINVRPGFMNTNKVVWNVMSNVYTIIHFCNIFFNIMSKI